MERTIAVVSDVKTLGELLNGAGVEQTRLVPSGGTLYLDMELIRACPELKTEVRRGLMTKTNIPWVKSRLRLNRIQDATVQRLTDGAPDQSPLLVCDAVPGGYTLVVTSPDGLRLSLKLETLDGQFADVGQPTHAP